MTIDLWTLGFQTVNVVILIWLLGRFFWTPIAGMIEQRRVAAQQVSADAEKTLREAAAAKADIERTRAGFAGERQAILSAAYAAAETDRASRVAAGEAEAKSLTEAAKAETVKNGDASEHAWADRSSHLAIDMAARLAARLDGATVRTAFLDWLITAIAALPEATRQAVAAPGVALEAISSAPLDQTDQEHYRDLIGKAFGSHPKIAFKTDPELINGLELYGPALVVRNSWRADLATILEDLTRDRR